MSFFTVFAFASVLFSVAAAVRFDLTNVTCAGLHGPHCGSYALKVVGEENLILGLKTFVGADVLSESAEESWGRYFGKEQRFLPKLTTVGTNETKNFAPLLFTTNHQTCNPQALQQGMVAFANAVTNEIQFDDWSFTARNVSVPTGLANQLFNATDYGVQTAQCYNGIASELLDAPTVNIFDQDAELPSFCTKIQFEPVCPPSIGF